MEEFVLLCDDTPENLELQQKMIEALTEQFGTQAVIIPGVTKRKRS